MTLRIGSLFTGYGGLDMGVAAFYGGEVVWHVENDRHAARILEHNHPDIPNHGDITKIMWSGVQPIDILVGGFPCQDVSHAGKRAGLTPDSRSGLWAWWVTDVHVSRNAQLKALGNGVVPQQVFHALQTIAERNN